VCGRAWWHCLVYGGDLCPLIPPIITPGIIGHRVVEVVLKFIVVDFTVIIPIRVLIALTTHREKEVFGEQTFGSSFSHDAI